jgi:hypothetical protein
MITVVDKAGWRKECPVQKNIVFIGSSNTNDIVLEQQHGAGIMATHLQVICLPPQGYRLINLSDQDIFLGASGERTLPSRASLDIGDGQQLKLGDFTLTFHSGFSGSGGPVGAAGDIESLQQLESETSSDFIGLGVILPQTTLSPDQPIDGAIRVRNQGDKPKVQFVLDVEGLEPDMYTLSPGPILFPNAEKVLPFRIYHPQAAKIAAGAHQIKIHATAPEAYPRERATALVTINILPFYKHKLRLEPAN